MRAIRTFFPKALSVVVVISAVTGGYLGYLRLSSNFHVVETGAVYRSAQPTPARMAEYKERYGIRTILNLRGSSPGAGWYDAESRAASEMGIELIDFRMSASKALTPSQAADLMEILKSAPKPLLIHCMAGSDRSGLASAIYLGGVRGANEEAAEEHLSLIYGHIGLPFVSAAYPMDETWEAIEPILGFHGS